jgi:hypothetical protein
LQKVFFSKWPGAGKTTTMETSKEPSGNKLKTWLKRVGIVGFLFFLIKGLVWLALFFFVGKSIWE